MGSLSQRYFKLFVSSLMGSVVFVLVCERPQSMSIVLPLMNGAQMDHLLSNYSLHKYLQIHYIFLNV